MSSPDVNQDLQTYFDTFKCDMEESDDCVTLTAEALRALSEADAVTEKILEEDAGTNSDDHQSTDLLKNVQGRKGIYYLKLSNKESIQVKLIEESSPPKSNEDISTEKETDDKACLGDTDEKKEKIYEFDENDPEVKRADNFPRDRQIEKLASGSVMHMVPRTNSSNVIASTQIHQCPKCFYTTNKRFLLSRHLHTHSDDRPYKCAVCDRAFKLSTALANHMNSHLNKKPHGCTYCEKRFNTSGELVRHIRYMHTGEKPHKCGECDYSSVELSKLRRHMRCHTGERPYQCPHCTYASPDTFKLKRHLRTHTGEKPYECDICLARFTQSNSLKAHRLIHSAGDRPSFQCSYCPTTCGRKTDLQLHMQKLHNPDRPVTCKRCRKELPDRYSYKVHVKTHEGEKCFRCTVCPHASISQRLLDMHMLIHTDEKPFCCEECGAAFRQRQLLVRHINFYHNDNYEPPIPSEKTHVCPHCNRAFSRKGNLMRHMETHDSQVDKEEEKIKLRIGRQIRIQPDGSICVPTNILECVISNDKTTRVVEDNETQVDDGYAILEIDDSDNVDSGGDGAVVLNSIKTDPNKLIEQRKYVVKQRNVIKQEQVKVKSHPSTDDANTDDDNEHIMVIEVIENDTENEGAITIENSKINESIIELPIQSGPKRNTANSHGFSNLGDYILPENYKNSQIQTIMDVINVD